MVRRKLLFLAGAWPRWVFSVLIHTYQRTLSPDHAFWAKAVFPHGYCRFHPSCSMYARTVIQRDGIIVGSVKSLWRILRCNPWSSGGVDEP